MHNSRDQLLACIPRLRRYARALVGERAGADDLVQDTVERGWARLASWEGGSDMRAWLFSIDTGFITNHLAFAKTAAGTRAYVTIGGENVVKVFTTDATPTLVATIPTGALPHGIWTSDDGTRVYVGLENGDAVDVIDSATNKVIARAPVGQAPQALVYVSNAVPHGDGMSNLVPRANSEPINIALKPSTGEAKGFIVARNLGVVDSLEVSLFKLKPQTVYSVYVSGQATPVANFKTNPMGMANGTAIGPMRDVSNSLNAKGVTASRVLVMEGDVAADPQKAVLSSVQ